MTMGATTMQRADQPAISKKRLWAGRIISGFAALFMLFDGVTKLFKPAFVVEATVRLGYPESTIVGMGLALVVSTLIYAVPRTSVLGAILLTGYLGGAVATNVRATAGWFNVLFPVVFGVLVWGGLWLRDRRLENLLPLAGPAKGQ